MIVLPSSIFCHCFSRLLLLLSLSVSLSFPVPIISYLLPTLLLIFFLFFFIIIIIIIIISSLPRGVAGRRHLWRRWCNILRRHGIDYNLRAESEDTCTGGYNNNNNNIDENNNNNNHDEDVGNTLTDFLSSPSARLLWRACDLPSDSLNLENAAVLFRAVMRDEGERVVEEEEEEEEEEEGEDERERVGRR